MAYHASWEQISLAPELFKTIAAVVKKWFFIQFLMLKRNVTLLRHKKVSPQWPTEDGKSAVNDALQITDFVSWLEDPTLIESKNMREENVFA